MVAVRDIALGAVAGLCATMVMTSTLRRLWIVLPPDERYPLPPREFGQSLAPASGRAGAVRAEGAQLSFGALAGAVYACLPQRRPPGIVYGCAVWAVSHFGRVPRGGTQGSVNRSPASRSAVMILAHGVWGVALGIWLKELEDAATQGFQPGRMNDTPEEAKATDA